MPKDALQRYRLVPNDTALLLVDFQEKLAAAMPPADRQICEKNIILLLDLAARQRWPVVVSEQYPHGLGATVPALQTALQAHADAVHKLEKLHFATTDAPEFAATFAHIQRRRWVVVGMEAHVCVFQTVRGLLDLGAYVFVPEDAVLSRATSNRHRGLTLMSDMGATITSSEVVVFDALQIAGTPDFKALSKQLR